MRASGSSERHKRQRGTYQHAPVTFVCCAYTIISSFYTTPTMHTHLTTPTWFMSWAQGWADVCRNAHAFHVVIRMEALLRRELATSKVIALGRSGGGCISEGQSYETDTGRVFVKHNSDPKVKHRSISFQSSWVCFFCVRLSGEGDVWWRESRTEEDSRDQNSHCAKTIEGLICAVYCTIQHML